MNRSVGMRDVSERCILPVSSRAGQAGRDKMAGGLWALSTGSGEGSSEPPLCLQSGEQRGFEKSASRAYNMAEACRDGAQQRVAGKHPLAIMPTSTLMADQSGSLGLSLGNWPSFACLPSCWLGRTSCKQVLLAIQGSGQNGAWPIKGSRRRQPCGFSGNVLRCFLRKLPLQTFVRKNEDFS